MTKYLKAKEPEDIPRLFTHYWNLRDGAGIASLFTHNAEFVNVVGLWWHTKKDIEKAHSYGLQVIFNKSKLELIKIKTKNIAQKVTVVHAKMRLQGQTTVRDIKQTSVRKNIFTFVAQQIDGQWLCVAAHNTDIVPGMETNVIDKEGRLHAVDYRKEKPD